MLTNYLHSCFQIDQVLNLAQWNNNLAGCCCSPGAAAVAANISFVLQRVSSSSSFAFTKLYATVNFPPTAVRTWSCLRRQMWERHGHKAQPVGCSEICQQLNKLYLGFFPSQPLQKLMNLRHKFLLLWLCTCKFVQTTRLKCMQTRVICLHLSIKPASRKPSPSKRTRSNIKYIVPSDLFCSFTQRETETLNWNDAVLKKVKLKSQLSEETSLFSPSS